MATTLSEQTLSQDYRLAVQDFRGTPRVPAMRRFGSLRGFESPIVLACCRADYCPVRRRSVAANGAGRWLLGRCDRHGALIRDQRPHGLGVEAGGSRYVGEF
jgi:hypothetical protein